MPAERIWYQLDGTWHTSVASKLSALHLPEDPDKVGAPICDPKRSVLLEDMPYPEAEAAASGRQCKRCLRAYSRSKT